MLASLLVVAILACDARVLPTVQPSENEATPAASLSDAELLRSTRFRGPFGLNTDHTWITTVATDPASARGVMEFGVPLLPAEIDSLLRRTHATPDIVDVIRDYGLTIPDDWIGVRAGAQADALVIVKVSRDDDWHREVLGRLLPDGAGFDVRSVEQSAAELEQFAARVRADRAWFETIGTRLLGVEIEPFDAVAKITFTGLDSSRSSDILTHFGGHPWIRPSWVSLPPWTGGLGDLLIKAVDSQGKPVKGLECAYWALDPVARYGSSLGFTTDADGSCRIEDLPASKYDLELWFGGEGTWAIVGTARVELRAGRSTDVTITVSLP